MINQLILYAYFIFQSIFFSHYLQRARRYKSTRNSIETSESFTCVLNLEMNMNQFCSTRNKMKGEKLEKPKAHCVMTIG